MEQAEGHGIPIPTSSSPESDHDDYHPDSPPVGSPDVTGFHLSPPAVLSDDLRCKIIKQVEYYFSDENLPNDKFLMKYVVRNDGYVPIGVIASFRKMKKLTRDMSLIVAALKESSLVLVSSNGEKVKRLQPLPLADAKDPMVCTILVENLPEDHSVENLNRVFGEAGKIMNITIRDPHDARESKKCTVAEKLISGKLHALVEYDTVEAAEKAVTLLNNEQDWRYGLRVKLLKKVKKTGQKKLYWRESESEKCNIVQASELSGNEENRDSSEQHESHDEELVSSNGEKVKRLHPLPLADAKDPMVCTILVENLPEDHSVENLNRVFGEAGKIKNITIRDPHDARESKKCTVAEKLISGKLHALVEYDTVEAAEKAVTLLNNKQDWRYGLRVKLLKKEKKPGQKKLYWRESESEKCNIVQASESSGNEENRDSSEQHESHDEEIVDQSSREKNGVHLAKDKNGYKGRNHAPGRRQKHHGPNGHGHGTQFSIHGIEPSKPPPGPKMPDGTRGFAVGRGRPMTTS